MLKNIKLFFIAFGLILSASFLNYSSVHADEKFDNLKNQILNAKDGEKIILENGEYIFTETLDIVGKNITLKNNGKVEFKRDNNFNKTMIKIDENSKVNLLSDDGNFIVDGEKREAYGNFIENKGFLKIGETGANGLKFINDFNQKTSFTSNKAPIFSDGKNSKIIFNAGEISNTDYESTPGAGNWYSAGGFIITNGATLEMNGGTIKDNNVSWFNYASFLDNKWAQATGSAGAVSVRYGSKFIMNGGTIEDNFSTVGGIEVGHEDLYEYHIDKSDPTELKDIPISEFILNNGIIKGNKGAGKSGGVFIFGAARAEMNGGEIIENKGYAGGGILALDYYTDGVQGVNRTYAKAPFEEWTKKYPAGFVMNAGKVNNNLAYTCGGGIDVASNNVKLLGGEIKNNIAGDQGGGVYLTATPYKLRIENAFVSNNEASDSKTWIHSKGVSEDDGNGGKKNYELVLGAGGGSWFCPTGDAEFYAENGAVFVDNIAEKAGSDFHNEEKVPGNYTVTLPTRLIGGTKVLYYEDSKGNRYEPSKSKEISELKQITKQLSLKAIIDENGKTVSKKLSRLIIEGNVANKGGGIGSNGSVIFGKKPNEENPLKEIEIVKTWEFGTTPEDIEIEVRGKLKDKTDYLIENVKLTKDNGYKFTLKDFPATVKGEKIEDIIYIKELNSDKYNVEISKIKSESKTKFSISIKNTLKIEKISIPVEKKWIGKEKDEVVIRLLSNGVFDKELKLNRGNSWKGEFKDLPKTDNTGKEINYTIEEVKVEGYESKVSGNVKNGFIITNKEIPKPEVEKISIPVEKKWIGKEKDEVVIRLLSNGVFDKELKLNRGNSWKGEFKDLPKTDNTGKEINYTIEEVKVEGYESKVSGNVKNGFVITNKEIPEKPSVPNPQKPKKENRVPKTSIGNSMFSSVTMLVISGGVLQILKNRKSK
ncbi:Cna B-type domain-containing protein [uncultured Parvimonas sp.]|uniref:Cna B-type domain-containing protein n=2 Tax=Parvimonas TaxID=543311 RepID=UPI0028041A20|nr:Cna B-type domain-containing protein [uncultured Parvimonas sp.]